MMESKLQKTARWLAMFVGIVWLGIGLLFGIGELGDEGVVSGIMHVLFPGLVVFLIALAAWRRPLIGGILFLILTAFCVKFFKPEQFIILAIFVPFTITGVMLVAGSLVPRRR